jgi:glycosyltransferase involved in cell wall biosynthesis
MSFPAREQHPNVVKTLHVITGLNTGGAEMMLAKLLSRMRGGDMENAVISLTDGGPLARQIADLGVPVTSLNMARGGLSPASFFRLVAALRQHKPDLIQAWMYHANLLTGLAARLVGRPALIWNIRQSDLDPRMSKRSTITVAKLGGRLSRWLPDKIVCCAETARRVHETMGYAPERMLVIPNGFDLDLFHPDPEDRVSLRRELGLDEKTVLVGLAARFDPQKDHRGFLSAAGMLRAAWPDVHYVLCGDGIDTRNDQLTGWIAAQGLANVCHLLGPRADMPHIMAGCDVMVSASAFGEGFPNVLGEAMAAGTPCVTTDVGDSRAIVGDVGRAVPPRDPVALAAAIADILRLSEADRHALGLAARARIAEHYAIDVIAARYDALYRETLAERG